MFEVFEKTDTWKFHESSPRRDDLTVYHVFEFQLWNKTFSTRLTIDFKGRFLSLEVFYYKSHNRFGITRLIMQRIARRFWARVRLRRCFRQNAENVMGRDMATVCATYV